MTAFKGWVVCAVGSTIGTLVYLLEGPWPVLRIVTGVVAIVSAFIVGSMVSDPSGRFVCIRCAHRQALDGWCERCGARTRNAEGPPA